MPHLYSPIVLLPYMISIFSSLILAIHAANHLQVRGALSYMIMPIGEAIWTMLYVFELLSPTLGEKMLWDRLQWIPPFMLVLAALHFTQTIIHRPLSIPWRLVIALLVVFNLVVIFLPAAAHVQQNSVLILGEPFDTLDYPFGVVEWFGTVCLYALLLVCVPLLIQERRHSDGQYHRMLTWVTMGIMTVVVLDSVMMIFNVRIFGQRDVSPFTFALGNAIIGWGIFRHRIFNLAPAAHQLIAQHMADAYVLVDNNDRIIDLNYAAKNTYSGALVGLIGAPIREVFPEWQVASADGNSEPVTRETTFRKEGVEQTLELRISPVFDPLRKQAGRLIVARNITERKALLDALHESETRYRSIVGTMNEGIVLFDRNGTVPTVNLSAQTMLGLTVDQIAERSPYPPGWGFIYEDGSPMAREDNPASETITTGKPLRDVIVGVALEDASVKWFSVNTQPLFRENEALPHAVVATFRDVTAFRQMQEQQMALALERERGKLLVSFIQSASHEFRTPLSVINTSLYRIKRLSNDPKIVERSHIAETQVERMDRLVGALVAMAKLDSGVPLSRTPARLTDLLQQTVERARRIAETNQQTILLDCAPALPKLALDSAQIFEALKELLDNAMRFSPHGASIVVIVRQHAGEISIAIRDAGPGIPADDLPHVFERFWRHDQAHTTEGFGLGLPLAQKIVELHDGRLSVETEVGCGSTFTIVLPIEPVHRAV